MKLLIVESPTKAKTIQKYLNKDFKVISSYGHVRTLPSRRGVVDPNKNFAVQYDTVKNLKVKLLDYLEETKILYLATDPDREGEAISWHIAEVIKEKKSIYQNLVIKRITFHEITKSSILLALKNPREINIDLVYAQRARQILDYLVGFNMSPILWTKLPGSKSAGRVQSVALKILCEREQLIDLFEQQEYWSIEGIFLYKNTNFTADLLTYQGEKLSKLSILCEESAESIQKHLGSMVYQVSDVIVKDKFIKPEAPFTTSTLIQESLKKLNFSAKKTMLIAQKLYEGVKIDENIVGIITYMRTDSTKTSEEALEEIRKYISSVYGNQYLPKQVTIYPSKIRNSQEAHESIRPTNFSLSPEELNQYLDQDCYRLYQLIWRRSISSQMNNAKFSNTSIYIISSDSCNIFKISISSVVFKGFYIIDDKNDCNSLIENKDILPQKNEQICLDNIQLTQHYTQSPARYTEGSLIKKMEKLGIGRPSTYSTILSILINRKYAEINAKKFFVTSRGRIVDIFLNQFFGHYVDFKFTADLESNLDFIASNKKSFTKVLQDFWMPFKDNVNSVSQIKNIDVIKIIEKLAMPYVFKKTSDKKAINFLNCLECDKGTLEIKLSKFGFFLGCSCYPDCNYRRTLFIQAKDSNSNIMYLLEEKDLRISLKKGPYGMYLQKDVNGQKNRKIVSVPSYIQTMSLNPTIIKQIINLPKCLGFSDDLQGEVFIKIGKYGLYLECNNKFYSLKSLDKINITMKEAENLILESQVRVR